MKPSIKVCGVKDPAFAAAAARRGVDYLGVIFAASSPRAVTCAAAQAVAAAARAARPSHPPRIVGVFVSHAVPEIVSLATAVPLDVVQLHGRYDAAAVQAIQAAGREVWRLSAAPGDAGGGEDAALLDGRTADRCGGTGVRADWSRVAELKGRGLRVVLAGGLAADTARAAAATGADILDVNSSLETAPGEKSVAKLDEFLACCGRAALLQ